MTNFRSKIRDITSAALDSRLRRASRHRLPPAAVEKSEDRLDYYLVTATIVKGEARFIREFVAFHRLVGVDHMLIYIDGGEDAALSAEIDDFVREKFVEILPWPRFLSKRNNQYCAYQHAIAYMRGKCRWLGMIDADEFLHAPHGRNLIEELQKREKYSALSVYSRTFGTGGVSSMSPGRLVTEDLVWRGADNHVKNRTQRTLADPCKILAVRSANTVVLASTDCLGWDEDGKKVIRTGEDGHGADHLRINHYFTRSEEDLKNKIGREYFGRTDYLQKMADKYAESQNDLNEVEDKTLHQFLPELKSAIARN